MKFIFLIYVSRSGSTMFAKQLDSHSSDLVVIPEFRLISILLHNGEESIKKLKPNQLLDLVNTDYQIESLGLVKATLKKIVEANSGKGIRPLIEDILNHYLKTSKKETKFVMLQLGGSINLYNKAIPVFPEAKFICIYRDPRAVVNSALHTNRPYFPKENMGRHDVIFAAQNWSKFLKELAIYESKQKAPILKVCYEELCTHNSRVVTSVLVWIGANYKSTESNGSQFEVGEREKEIHKLINKPPVIERTNAWKKELSRWQGIVIEIITEHTMKTYNYNLFFLKNVNRFTVKVYFFYAYIIHVYRTILFYRSSYWRRVVSYCKNPRRLLLRIKH